MSRIRRLFIAVTAVGLSVPGFLLTAPQSAAAAGCSATNHVAGDLNSDGLADVVTGVPSYDGDRGAVDVLFSDGTRLFLRPIDFGVTAAAGDRFGESLALGDVDDDGCADVAVGVPGYGSSTGRVYLFRGAADHTLAPAGTFNGSAPHGSFGAQVVLLTPQKLTPSGWVRTNQQLVVSAPTADDGAAAEAGHVQVLPLAGTFALAAPRVVLTQNSPGVPGTSEDFDRFGTALAGQQRTIVIGTPDEAVGTRSGAGSVTFLSATAAAPTTFAGPAVTQNSAGVPGTSETADHFGAAVAFRDNYTLIGVPREDISADADTGSVHVLHHNPSARTYTSLRSLSQDTTGIPGANEDDDLFGSSLALGINTVDQLTAVVGAPGEGVGTASGAGMVTLFRANMAGGGTATLRQGAGGIAGSPETGDNFGASVGIVSGDLDDGEAMQDGVVVGVPGENLAADTPDAGAVHYSRTMTSWFSLLLEAAPTPMPADARFGEVAASVAAA